MNENTETPSANLVEALEKYQIELAADQIKILDAYRELLWDYNTKLNLTRHTDFDKFVSRDILDSIHLANLLAEEEQVFDVGTGGGVPGLILSILRPDLVVCVCESVNKKAVAVEAMISELGLPVTMFAGRAEDVLEDFRFDSTVARAVGPLWKMCFWFQDVWISVGRLLAIKGPNWPNERAEARHRGVMQGIELRKLHEYPMPGTENNSVILQLKPHT